MYASDLKHTSATLQDKLHQLYTLNRNKKIDLSFRPPFLNLLQASGNPHLKLPPVIHVAGTNGKGSIIAILRSILETAGYSIHAYTSPHLIDFNERIVLAGKEIENDPLEELIDEALALNGNGDLTFFEITTAIAFAAFSRSPADICLLEVGMGGRLDCTNVIENPLVSVINAIGMDHAEHLGETITKIAAEKAGIMKPGVPCVIGLQNDDTVMDVFETKAAALNVSLHSVSSPTNLPVSLPGAHQKANAATALTALEHIQDRFPITQEQIKTGLENIVWPARLQKLNSGDFDLDGQWEIFLDGGHNADAGQALAAFAKQNDKALHVILAMMNGKDAQAFLEPLKPFIDTLCVVNIEGEPQSQNAADLKAIFPEAHICENYLAALKHLQKQSPSRILICGSLYLAGQVLSHGLKEQQK